MPTTAPKPSRNGVAEVDISPDSLLVAAQEIGLTPPIQKYKPAKHDAVCREGYRVAKRFGHTMPGPANAIKQQAARLARALILLNQERKVAWEELVGNIRRQEQLAEAIHQRQPMLLTVREALQQQRAEKRVAFAKVAAGFGIVLNPETLTVEEVLKALGLSQDFGARPVPVPGEPGRFSKMSLAFIKAIAPLFCSIPISLSLGVLTGVIPLNQLQDIETLSPTLKAFLVLFWLIGAALHHVLWALSKEIGILYARATFEGHIKNLPGVVKLKAMWGTFLLLALWALLSMLEGYGLFRWTDENAYMSDAKALPLWFCFLIGGATNGLIATFPTYHAFNNGCRELAKHWPWKSVANEKPPVVSGKEAECEALMAAASELMEFNSRIGKIDQELSRDKASLEQKPRISAETLQRIDAAQREVDREADRLRELSTYVYQRTGTLTPRLDMGEVEVPTKMILLPLQRIWLHLRGEKRDEWPTR